MVTCHLCGETIEEHNLEGMGIQCSTCGSNYCGRCSITIYNCIKCGENTEGFNGNRSKKTDDPSISMVNLRRHSREIERTTVEYIVAPTPGSNETWKKVRALTKNVSEGGMCIYTKLPHKVGQILRFADCSVCGKSSEAKVCWVKKIDESVYLAGLIFV